MGRSRGAATDSRQQAQVQTREKQQAPDYRELAIALSVAAGAAGAAAGTSLVVGALVGLGIPEVDARLIAPIVMRDVPVVDGTISILRVARVEQIIYRAMYAIQASRRLARARAFGGAGEVARQLEREELYYRLHLEANARRENSAVQTIRAIQRYGELLSWNATIRPSNRPHHRAAHRKNWRPLDGIPLLTGALPATLPFCLCYSGPPVSGAEVLAAPGSLAA